MRACARMQLGDHRIELAESECQTHSRSLLTGVRIARLAALAGLDDARLASARTQVRMLCEQHTRSSKWL